MACRGRWIRKGNKPISVQVTPAAGSSPSLINLGLREINRDTGNANASNFTATQLAAGVSWNLQPRRIYEMALIVLDVGDAVDVEITIGSTTVFQSQCTSSAWPITGRWKVTTI